LASMTEIYGSNNGNVAEGTQFQYWKNTGNAAKIKYEGSTARSWFLRGPFPGNALGVRRVDTSGALSSDNARHAVGLVLGLCIG
jgi:hypothetical protein